MMFSGVGKRGELAIWSDDGPLLIPTHTVLPHFVWYLRFIAIAPTGMPLNSVVNLLRFDTVMFCGLGKRGELAVWGYDA